MSPMVQMDHFKYQEDIEKLKRQVIEKDNIIKRLETSNV